MKTRKILFFFLSIALLANVAASPLCGDLAAIFVSKDPALIKGQRVLSFRTEPVLALEKNLKILLPKNASVSLSSKLFEDDFSRQRLSEELYPILVDQSSPHQISIDEKDEQVSISVTEGKQVRALGMWPRIFPPVWYEETHTSILFSLVLFITLTVAAAGLGYLLSSGTAVAFSASFIYAAVLIGLVFHLSAWFRFEVPSWLIPSFGLGAVLFRFRSWSQYARSLPVFIRSNWVPLAIAGVFFSLLSLRHLALPVTMWDGRSIWLFRAKQIFHTGSLDQAITVNPNYAWSHPEYPLLLPAWMSFFNSFNFPNFSERIASLSLCLLFGALCVVSGHLMRERFEKWDGFALMGVISIALAWFSSHAIADGFLSLLLVIEYLALTGDKQNSSLGWWSALAASLIKIEGLFLAAGILILLMMLRKTKFSWRIAFFIPALIHIGWSKVVGIKGDFHDAALPLSAQSLIERLGAILSLVYPIFLSSFFLLTGASAFLLTLLFSRKWRLPASFYISLGLALFPISAYLVTARPLIWHVQTSADRLLLHFAVFSLVAFADALTAHTKSRIELMKNAAE